MQTLKGLLLLSLFSLSFTTQAVTIELWHPRPESVNFWPQVIQSFKKKHPDIQLNVTYLPAQELKLAIIRTVFQKHSPDIALTPSDFIGNFKQMKLSTVTPDMLSPNQHPKFLTTTHLGELNYGVPLIGGNHLLLYYNKKFVKQPATTWRELITQQAALLQQGITPIALKYNEMYWFTSFITAYGGFPVDGNKITLNTQAVINALTFYRGLTEQKLVPATCGYSCVTDDFFAEKFAYSINGEWAYKQTAEQLGEHFAAATIPNIGDKVVRPMFSSLALIFPNKSLEGKKAEAIKKLAQFLQTEAQQQKLYQITGFLPTHTKVVEEIKKSADDNHLASLKQLSNARAMPPSQAMAAAWTGMSKAFKLFMDNKITAEQTAALMQKIAQRELDKMSATR